MKESDMVKIGNGHYSKKFLMSDRVWRIGKCYYSKDGKEYCFHLGDIYVPLYMRKSESEAEYERAVRIVLDLRA